MSQGSVRKKGYLFKLPVNGLVKKWSRRWFVLHATGHEGVVRIEYFDTSSNELTGTGKRTIPLRDVSALAQIAGSKVQPYVFQFNSQIGFHVFATESQSELDEWVEGIKESVKEDRMRMRKKKTHSLVITSGDEDFSDRGRRKESGSTYTHEPSNAGTYRITLEQNDTTEKLNLSGSYNLEITPNNLLLISPTSGATLIVWQYKHLKNYGKMHGRVHFETGRGAQCGVGSFVFVTTCSKEIFGIIHRNIKKLRAVKEEQQKQDLETQVSQAVASASKAPKQTTKTVTKPVKTEERARPKSKAAEQGVAGDQTTGTYRTSRDFESGHNQEEQSHAYDLLGAEEGDTSLLYAQVDKTGKIKNSSAAPPPPPAPYASTQQANALDLQNMSFDPLQPNGVSANRTSYSSARDSRDSTLMEHNPLASDDNELSPLTTPVYNPFGGATIGTNPSFNTGQFDDENFFTSLDQMDMSNTSPAYNPPPAQPQFNTQDPWSPQQSSPFGQFGQQPPQNRQLSTQELDDIWKGISTTISGTHQF